MKAEVVRKRMLIKYRDDRYSMGHMALFNDDEYVQKKY